jgi:hypothetical protein
MTLVLRTFAVLIAVAGFIDPAFTMAGRSRARVAIVVQDGPTMDLPAAAGSTRHEVAARVRTQLAKDLGDDYDIQPRQTSDAAAAIVIGDSYQPGHTFTAPTATVTVHGDVSPNVRILRVDSPRDVPVGTAIRIGVDAEGAGVNGRSSTIVVGVGGLEVGRASHVWRGDRERWHADIDAVPVGEPPFVVRVESLPLDLETTPLDNAADALVAVRPTPFRVQLYEPRPSWATTFIRRVLEDDARFQVAGFSATSKSIATRSGDATALTNTALDAFDVVIVGGVERLTASEAYSLDRFMRVRGGAVVLVPDVKPSTAPALDLLHGLTLTERLSERPEKLAAIAPLAPLQASELLLIATEPPLTDRLVVTSGANPSAVIVSMPRGAGRLVVSGALDAWRFRTEDDNAFDRFWQSTIAGLALTAPSSIDLNVMPAMVKPGGLADVVVRVSGERAVRAAVDGRPVRLWPDADAGVFRGSFTARETEGRSTVLAELDGATPGSAARPFVVSRDARAVLPAVAAPLSLLSASHNGIDATPDKIGDVEQFIRRTVSAPPATVTRHPMRSAWWMLPFAACLSGEWYLRRRRGAR